MSYTQRKLTAEQVVELRNLYRNGEGTTRGLAERFGISNSRVTYILRGSSYTDVPGALTFDERLTRNKSNRSRGHKYRRFMAALTPEQREQYEILRGNGYTRADALKTMDRADLIGEFPTRKKRD